MLQYIAVLMLFVLAVGATGGMIALSMLVGKKARIQNTSTIEEGFEKLEVAT